MAARLVSLDGSAPIPIDRALIVVGRHPRCDARLDSPHVSRRHCCLVQDGNELVVRDLGSLNGTRINGRRVEEGRLGPGAELAIAWTRFRPEGDSQASAGGQGVRRGERSRQRRCVRRQRVVRERVSS
jgi:pSer/pThr/pTyr-binding forkhead associated (FHA) protein